ncbi:hypothetical protein NOR53_2730 [gamma proteobacterium NOR5-3]|nr:hypothetical protein NOR53_2730 [gamma proteobacterium NOR5-3]
MGNYLLGQLPVTFPFTLLATANTTMNIGYQAYFFVSFELSQFHFVT